MGAEFSKVFERTPSGEFVGLGVDVIRALAAQTKDTVRFEIYPWPRAQAMVELGQADILIGPYKTPEREERFSFLDRPFYQDRMVFFARSGNPIAWTGNFDSLKGIHIAAVSGWVYGSAFDHARRQLRVSNAPKPENGVLMLVHGHVDLLAANRRNIEPVLAALRLTNSVTELAPIVDVQNGYLAFPRKVLFDAMRLRYNQAFNELVERGELTRLGRKHDVQVP
ncbi:MAG: transporter substrate-binding domain-containing protein [Pseudomonadota bacterium]